LGIGDWAPIPNPQSQSPIFCIFKDIIIFLIRTIIILFYNYFIYKCLQDLQD